MFSLDRNTAKITNINIRTEKHGDDDKVAIDLTINVNLPNTHLAEFHSQLRSALYEYPDNTQGNLVDPEMTKLKFPLLHQVKWELEMTGYEMKVHYGISGVSDVNLTDAKLNKFSFAPQEGGTVGIKFMLAAYPTSQQVGQLSAMIGNNIEMSLIEPVPMEEAA